MCEVNVSIGYGIVTSNSSANSKVDVLKVSVGGGEVAWAEKANLIVLNVSEMFNHDKKGWS